MSDRPLNFLCISTFFKGVDFLKRCKAEGNNVYLLTMKKLEHENWPHESLDDIFYIDTWNDRDISKGIAYKYRTIKFDRFVALDDFDVEKVASLREHFRMPGMRIIVRKVSVLRGGEFIREPCAGTTGSDLKPCTQNFYRYNTMKYD